MLQEASLCGLVFFFERKKLCGLVFFFFFERKKTSSLCVLSFCVTSEGLPRRVRQLINWSNTAGAGNH